MVQCHGQTLLPRFLGMYRVSVDSEDTYLLVMRNLFSHRLPVHRKYDLKVSGCPLSPPDSRYGAGLPQKPLPSPLCPPPQGSLVDREASDKEKVPQEGAVTLPDLWGGLQASCSLLPNNDSSLPAPLPQQGSLP